MKRNRSSFYLAFLLILLACQKEDHGPIEVQEIHINEGWNFFSTYLEISEDIEILFADHLDKIQIIQNPYDSSMYWPETGNYSLNRILFFKGYNIRALEEFTLQLTGTVCKPEKIIFTLRGPSESIPHHDWTLIPYIRKTMMTTWNLYEIIGDNLIIMKDEDGGAFWPSFGADAIDSLCPGQAYQIRCSEETQFSFPTNEI
ncbi:MAG: hypothetical protein K9H64_04165 [Bacteroidales bacterium]|nr:hypothetical protein [Bacteroidales bacterium]MCF8455037.1 hypothetical protein [Bacteroidales bacterium]